MEEQCKGRIIRGTASKNEVKVYSINTQDPNLFDKLRKLMLD
jgi:hypothetical protein